MSSSERSNLPSSSSKIRSRATFRRAARPPGRRRHARRRAGREARPDLADRSSRTSTRASDTRWTTAFMFSRKCRYRRRGSGPPPLAAARRAASTAAASLDQLEEAFEEQTRPASGSGRSSSRTGGSPPQDLAKALAEQNALEYVDLSETDLDLDAATAAEEAPAATGACRSGSSARTRSSSRSPTQPTSAAPTTCGSRSASTCVSPSPSPTDLERTIRGSTAADRGRRDQTRPRATFDPIAHREDIAESSDDTPAISSSTRRSPRRSRTARPTSTSSRRRSTCSCAPASTA